MPHTQTTKNKKVFVLDTSVILYDHRSIFEFQEHDVAIPISVLEELDNFKKGSDTKNFEARQFIRALEEIATVSSLQSWQPINGLDKGRFRVVMSKVAKDIDANQVFMGNKMDHQIINAALSLKEEEPERTVILVTKDINLRLKARALNMQAEDYETGKIKDVERLYKGNESIDGFPQTLIDALHKKTFISLEKIQQKLPDFEPKANAYFVLTGSKSTALAYYNPREERLELVEKRQCYGIKPRNAEQAFALHAVMNADVKLVSLSGVAGTGKTLLALAAALEQRREYRQVYLSRPIVPLSNKDLGYLPGDMKAKVDPYMQALWDNLKHIKNQYKETDKEFKSIDEMVQTEKIVVTPLAYIRGSSLSNVIFIVDEAQNLTPHEIKTVITRAGENAKFIFTGDVFQIDTPYLDEHSNGLSYMIDKLAGNELFASVVLEKGERSELANVANALL